jgi:hypothetical protein
MIIIAVHLLSDCKFTGYLFNSNPFTKNGRINCPQTMVHYSLNWTSTLFPLGMGKNADITKEKSPTELLGFNVNGGGDKT